MKRNDTTRTNEPGNIHNDTPTTKGAEMTPQERRERHEFAMTWAQDFNTLADYTSEYNKALKAFDEKGNIPIKTISFDVQFTAVDPAFIAAMKFEPITKKELSEVGRGWCIICGQDFDINDLEDIHVSAESGAQEGVCRRCEVDQ